MAHRRSLQGDQAISSRPLELHFALTPQLRKVGIQFLAIMVSTTLHWSCTYCKGTRYVLTYVVGVVGRVLLRTGMLGLTARWQLAATAAAGSDPEPGPGRRQEQQAVGANPGEVEVSSGGNVLYCGAFRMWSSGICGEVGDPHWRAGCGYVCGVPALARLADVLPSARRKAAGEEQPHEGKQHEQLGSGPYRSISPLLWITPESAM